MRSSKMTFFFFFKLQLNYSSTNQQTYGNFLKLILYITTSYGNFQFPERNRVEKKESCVPAEEETMKFFYNNTKTLTVTYLNTFHPP